MTDQRMLFVCWLELRRTQHAVQSASTTMGEVNFR